AEGGPAVDGLLLSGGLPAPRHVVTNLVVELEPSDRAQARSTFTVFQARPDFPLQPIICGRYHDTFARVAGAWRFADRLIVPELIGDLSRHLRPGPGPARGGSVSASA